MHYSSTSGRRRRDIFTGKVPAAEILAQTARQVEGLLVAFKHNRRAGDVCWSNDDPCCQILQCIHRHLINNRLQSFIWTLSLSGSLSSLRLFCDFHWLNMVCDSMMYGTRVLFSIFLMPNITRFNFATLCISLTFSSFNTPLMHHPLNIRSERWMATVEGGFFKREYGLLKLGKNKFLSFLSFILLRLNNSKKS